MDTIIISNNEIKINGKNVNICGNATQNVDTLFEELDNFKKLTVINENMIKIHDNLKKQKTIRKFYVNIYSMGEISPHLHHRIKSIVSKILDKQIYLDRMTRSDKRLIMSKISCRIKNIKIEDITLKFLLKQWIPFEIFTQENFSGFYLTQDLFFSGHTASTFLLLLCLEKKNFVLSYIYIKEACNLEFPKEISREADLLSDLEAIGL
jgi:hypothetical protein